MKRLGFALLIGGLGATFAIAGSRPTRYATVDDLSVPSPFRSNSRSIGVIQPGEKIFQDDRLFVGQGQNLRMNLDYNFAQVTFTSPAQLIMRVMGYVKGRTCTGTATIITAYVGRGFVGKRKSLCRESYVRIEDQTGDRRVSLLESGAKIAISKESDPTEPVSSEKRDDRFVVGAIAGSALVASNQIESALAANFGALLLPEQPPQIAHVDPPTIEQVAISHDKTRLRVYGSSHALNRVTVNGTLAGTYCNCWPLRRFEAIVPLSRKVEIVAENLLGTKIEQTFNAEDPQYRRNAVASPLQAP